jgi:DNA polymerase-3 subunit beta
MKFVCTKENLLRGLAQVVPVAGRNSQLPILQHVLLRLHEGVLHLTCTDLEIGIHTTVPGKVETSGGCTVVARKFMEYVQNLPGTHPVILVGDTKQLKVSTEGYDAHFPIMAADEFPLLPTPEQAQSIKIVAKDFCQGLSRTLFASARDTMRPEIHSVFIRGDAQQVTMAATDSFRLVENTITLNQPGAEFTFLLPLPTAQEVVRLFGDHETISLIPQDTHIVCRAESLEISSRLVDGSYPDYKQIIPQNFKTTGEVGKEELLRALKTMTVFLPRDSRRIQLVVDPKVSTLTLSVSGTDVGAGTVELEFSGTGEKLTTLFNIQYLMEGIQNMSGEKVQLQFVGDSEPACFSPAAGSGYTYVVMPIQA